MIKAKGCHAIVIILVMCTSKIAADEYHYNNVLIGDRASGLGGAYTAISDDTAGLFYNPAGIVFSDQFQLSASANALHTMSLKYKGVLNGGDWIRDSSTFIPNYFGMSAKLGDGYFGFSYAVTDSDVEDQDSVFTSIPGISLYIINLNNNETVTKIGPSYAIKINDNLNVGITLYFHNRKRELINNQWIRLSDNTYEWSNLYVETTESGIEPIIGLMWSPSDSISLGLSLRKTVISSSKTRTQRTCSSNIEDPAIQPNQCIPILGVPINPSIITTSLAKRELPLNSRFGVAYFPSDRLLLSADLSYFEAVKSAGYNAEETINIAVGLEYYLSNQWAIRGGYYTNNANTPDIVVGQINQADHVDLSGFSLSLTRFTKTSSVSAGLYYASGDGKAQVIAGSSEIQDLEQSIKTVILSTSYKF